MCGLIAIINNKTKNVRMTRSPVVVTVCSHLLITPAFWRRQAFSAGGRQPVQSPVPTILWARKAARIYKDRQRGGIHPRAYPGR